MAVATGVMERLAAAVNAHDVRSVTECFAPDGELEVLSTGLVWTGREQIGQVVDYLMATFRDLSWRPRNRWLDAGGATEEGVWSGTCVPDPTEAGHLPSAVPVELPARILVEHDGTSIRRLRLSTDITGLRLALGLPVSATAAALDTSQYRTRTRQSQLKVHVRPADEALPVLPVVEPDQTRRPARQRRRRRPVLPRWLTALLAAVTTVAVGGGVVYLAASGAPERTPQPAGAGTVSSPPTSRPAATVSRTPTRTPTPKATDGVTQRGNRLDLSTDVLFAKNSDELTGKARAAIDQVITLLTENKITGRILVIGYTDDVGTEAYNLRLSRKRAQAVVKALEARPEAAGLVFRASGKGEADPAGDNDTEVGKALNRRVTITLPET